MNYAISIICGAFLALVFGGRRSICPPVPPTPPEIKPPEPPCPPIRWKDLLTMLGGALGAFLYILFMKVHPTFSSIDFVAANIAAVALGGLVYRLFCPFK
jgi:hypothetical protein